MPARDMKVCSPAGRLVSRLSQYSRRVHSGGSQWGEILPAVLGEMGSIKENKAPAESVCKSDQALVGHTGAFSVEEVSMHKDGKVSCCGGSGWRYG